VAASPPRAPNSNAQTHASAVSNAPYATSPATATLGAFFFFAKKFAAVASGPNAHQTSASVFSKPVISQNAGAPA
jgi:hypothetical protein